MSVKYTSATGTLSRNKTRYRTLSSCSTRESHFTCSAGAIGRSLNIAWRIRGEFRHWKTKAPSLGDSGARANCEALNTGDFTYAPTPYRDIKTAPSVEIKQADTKGYAVHDFGVPRSLAIHQTQLLRNRIDAAVRYCPDFTTSKPIDSTRAARDLEAKKLMCSCIR